MRHSTRMSTKTVTTPDTARARIAVNLRRLRTERGLSQERMAELADFHRTYVSQLERCVTNISIDGLERIAHALGIDVVELLVPALDDGGKLSDKN